VKACRPGSALLAAAALAAAAVAALPAVGSADPTPPVPCATILAPRPALELPVRVTPGLLVRVRDPYGGVFARTSRFVAFSIRFARPSDRARLGAVTWLLDGRPPRRDEGGRDQLLAPSRMYAPGPHVITVRIAPARGGPRVEAQLQVTATDCRFAFAVPAVDRAGRLTLVADSGGPALRAVEIAPTRGRFAVPGSGRLGTVTWLPGGTRRALKAAELSAGGRRLHVAGAPLGTTAARVRLAPGVAPQSHRCAMIIGLQGGAGAPARLVTGPRC
jgi:hypothetical protein